VFEISPNRGLGLGHCIPIVIGRSLVARIDFVYPDRAVVGLLATFIDEALQRIGESYQLCASLDHIDRLNGATPSLQTLPALKRPVEHAGQLVGGDTLEQLPVNLMLRKDSSEVDHLEAAHTVPQVSQGWDVVADQDRMREI